MSTVSVRYIGSGTGVARPRSGHSIAVGRGSGVARVWRRADGYRPGMFRLERELNHAAWLRSRRAAGTRRHQVSERG
jgi:hypothetical protein